VEAAENRLRTIMQHILNRMAHVERLVIQATTVLNAVNEQLQSSRVTTEEARMRKLVIASELRRLITLLQEFRQIAMPIAQANAREGQGSNEDTDAQAPKK
jgi:ribosomal protein L12E/L44/L45/RPP1/RPP2